MDSHTPKIIYVEDNEAVRSSVSHILRFSGYEPMTYSSASDLFLAGTLAEADCLIADLMLPGMSGSKLIRKVRDDGNEIPAILVSGDLDHQTFETMKRLKKTDCLSKPFALTDLLRLIENTTSNI